MARVSIEVPEELASMVEAVVGVFDAFDDGGDFAVAERELMEKTAELETKALLGMLRALATSVTQRWDAAMTELLAAYRRQVTLLPGPT